MVTIKNPGKIKPLKCIGFIILLSISGCDELNELFQGNEHYTLPEIYKTSLKEGDTLIFKSSTNENDTFVIKNIVTGNIQLALSGTSGKEPYAYHEFELIIIANIKDSYSGICYNKLITQQDGNFGEGAHADLNTDCLYQAVGISVGLRDLWNVTYEDADKDFTPSINWYGNKGFVYAVSHETIIIKDITYHNVLEFTSDSNIKRLFFSYQQGILEYVDSNNIAWIKN
jgi:hypothetical protein